MLGAILEQPALADKFLKADAYRVLRVYKNVKRLPLEVRTLLGPLLNDAFVDAKIAELQASGSASKSPSALEYAQAAGLVSYYLTDYAFSSEAAHHVAKDLERQIAVDEKGEVDGMFWGPEREEPAELLLVALDYMLMACVAAEKLFELDPSGEGQKLREHTNRLIESGLSATVGE